MRMRDAVLTGVAGLFLMVCANGALAEEAAVPKKDAVAKDGPQNPPAAWEDEIHRKLSHKVSFEFVDTPIQEALTFLQTVSRVNVVLDPKAVEKGLKPLNLRVTDMDMETALKWICKMAELTFKLRNQAIFVTLDDEVNHGDTGFAAYRLRDGFPENVTAEKLKELSAVAAPQARVAYDAGLKLLQIACDEPRDLRRIETLLQTMGVDTANWEDEIRKRLSRKVSFEFVDTPIQEAVAFLRSLTNITMVLDPKVVEKGLKPVTLRVTDTDLKAALEMICRLSGLTCKQADHGLFITKRHEEEPGFLVCCLRQRLPAGVTAEKLKELSAVGAPKARVAYDESLKLLLIACDEPKDLGRVKSLLKTLGVDTEIDRVTKPDAAQPEPPPAAVQPPAPAPDAPQKPGKDF